MPALLQHNLDQSHTLTELHIATVNTYTRKQVNTSRRLVLSKAKDHALRDVHLSSLRYGFATQGIAFYFSLSPN